MGDLVLKGATSGQITLTPTGIAGTNTLTLPANTGTVVTTGSSGVVTTAMLASGAVTRAILPAGAILQVVQATTTSTISSSSSTMVASGLIATITPTASSSKIFIILTGGNQWNDTNASGTLISFYRSIAAGAYSSVIDNNGILGNTSGTNTFKTSWSASYLDSPSTTSSVSYQPYYRTNSSGTSRFNESSVSVQLTLFEVAA